MVEAALADASLGARVCRSLSPHQYNRQSRYAERIRIGDPELDSRLADLCNGPAAARRFLANPSLRPVLLSLKHVDLTVSRDGVRFQGAFSANVWGLSAQALVDLHNQAAHILARAAAAMQAACKGRGGLPPLT